MKLKLPLFILAGCLFANSTASADSFFISHSCYKPSKPYSFNNEWEVEAFKSEVEDYKRCISDFVEEQNDAARRHQEAAEEAISEWNSFVNYEL